MNPALLLVTVLFASGPVLPSFRLQAAEPAEPRVEGTWKWTFTMADGTESQPRAKIQRDGSKLTGTSIPRTGFEAPLVGSIDGTNVTWTVVREQGAIKTTTRYTGRLSGATLTGTIESDWNGRKEVYPWTARRASDAPDGTWRWETSFGGQRGGRGFETRAVLKLSEGKLTGSIKGRTSDTEISEASFKEGNIAFEVVRDRGGNRIISRYWGKLDGDTISGKTETDTGSGEVRPVKWEATRLSE